MPISAKMKLRSSSSSSLDFTASSSSLTLLRPPFLCQGYQLATISGNDNLSCCSEMSFTKNSAAKNSLTPEIVLIYAI